MTEDYFKKAFAELFKDGSCTREEFKTEINKAIKKSKEDKMIEDFDIRTYEAKYTFYFDEHNFRLATKANILLKEFLEEVLKELNVEIECNGLKEWKDDR